MVCSEINCKNIGTINVDNIWMLCSKCHNIWIKPDQEGIVLPHPTNTFEHKENNSGEVFMFGPDAM